jgi:hypothetical protein
LFGRLKVKDKKIEHIQLEKPKVAPTAPGRKLTIKSLLDKEEKPRKLPKLDEPEKKNSESLMDTLKNNRTRLSGQPKDPNQSGNLSFIEKLSCTYREGDEEDSAEMKLESPTRRYKKRQIDIKKEMLGAGVDPLNKDQDFSVLAKTGKNLMGAHFIKPGASKTRFPPVINVFSRTLASPICSSPFPLPLPHRISSNLSKYCIGLYVHE